MSLASELMGYGWLSSERFELGYTYCSDVIFDMKAVSTSVRWKWFQCMQQQAILQQLLSIFLEETKGRSHYVVRCELYAIEETKQL